MNGELRHYIAEKYILKGSWTESTSKMIPKWSQEEVKTHERQFWWLICFHFSQGKEWSELAFHFGLESDQGFTIIQKWKLHQLDPEICHFLGSLIKNMSVFTQIAIWKELLKFSLGINAYASELFSCVRVCMYLTEHCY